MKGKHFFEICVWLTAFAGFVFTMPLFSGLLPMGEDERFIIGMIVLGVIYDVLFIIMVCWRIKKLGGFQLRTSVKIAERAITLCKIVLAAFVAFFLMAAVLDMPERMWTTLGPFIAVIFIGGLFIPGFIGRLTGSLTASLVGAVGTVLTISQTGTDVSQKRRMAVEVCFMAGGREITATEFFDVSQIALAHLQPGAEVPLYYLPINPQKIMIAMRGV